MCYCTYFCVNHILFKDSKGLVKWGKLELAAHDLGFSLPILCPGAYCSETHLISIFWDMINLCLLLISFYCFTWATAQSHYRLCMGISRKILSGSGSQSVAWGPPWGSRILLRGTHKVKIIFIMVLIFYLPFPLSCSHKRLGQFFRSDRLRHECRSRYENSAIRL